MWRQNPFPGADDSDQSLSDDEEFDGDSSRNCVSLSGCAERKEGSQILSQLERLRGASKIKSAMKCDLSIKKPAGFDPLEDEVEIPSSGIEGGFFRPVKGSPKCCLDEETISDDEDDSVLPKFSITSSEKKAAVKGRAKPNFSLGCYLKKNESSSSFLTRHESLVTKMVSELPESSKNAQDTNARASAANDLSDSEEEKDSDSPIESHVEVPGHGHSERSMAEILDGLCERLPTGLPTEYSQFSRKGHGMQLVMKRSIAIVEDSEDEPESMDSDSPGEEERNFQNLKVPLAENKRRTLVDCFQDILDASPWKDRDALLSISNTSSLGLFGRLQQVMQNEKDRELEFMNNLHTSGTSCLYVLILSSYLDAKLIVCRCSLEKISGRLLERNSPESVSLWRGEKTVIFSSRTCSSVDLEVGKVICIYPPWKEIRVEGDTGSILLCTCFSQVPF